MGEWTTEDVLIDSVVVPEQPRKMVPDAPNIQGLAASVRAHGIQQRLGGFRADGKVVLLYGHRRLAAAKLAGLKSVPMQIHNGPLDRKTIAKLRLAENLNRVDLTPLEEAESYLEVMSAAGMTARDVAGEYGKSDANVSKTTQLLRLPEAIQALLRRQQIPWSAGYELVQVADPQEQLRLAQQLVEKKLTRDALRGEIKRSKHHASKATSKGLKRATACLGEGRSVSVAGGGSSLDAFIACLEEGLTRARKSRTKGHSLATFCKTLRDEAKANGIERR